MKSAERAFIPGLQLADAFYHEAVRPILDAHFPGLVYSAALIGWGSDVLGFDTQRSTDHMWGPRLLVFLADADSRQLREGIDDTLSHELPLTFRGYPTNFSAPAEGGVRWMEESAAYPVHHLVRLSTISEYFKSYLGFDPNQEIGAADWLTFSEQKLLSVTSGRVFHDGLGLEQVRQKFSYYPRDVWLYLLQCQWMKIAQEEHFVGRCGDVGDELGSRLIATRIVQYLMHLCFLMERRYAPYSKWFGSAFSRLNCAPRLLPILDAVLAVSEWREREQNLSRAYEIAAEMHNGLSITQPLPARVSPFFSRPYLVIHANAMVQEINQAIGDEALRQLAPIGSVDQFSDSTDIVSDVEICRRLRVLFSP